MLARFEPVGLILSPFLPVGGANFYWPPRFGVDPGISETATGEDERMQLVFIRDRKGADRNRSELRQWSQ
jgi:hypothetical protein